ncbi:MAG: inositol monophosphatase [Dehalococcoidia bacterium]|nr:inositol monophosphatase [Dehalococcoidia bacterium]
MPTPALPTSTSGRSALEVARTCAAEAGRVIRDGFGKVAVAETKGRGNVVTEVDFAAERVVLDLLQREFPDHAVLSEETAASIRSPGWMWVVDPLDGTKNFSRGIPHFAFNLALCFEERPLLALTSQPILGEEFLAVAGEGCTLNGVPVRVSGRETVRESVFALDLGYDDARARRQLELALGLWPGMQSLRIPGSAALGFAYVAAGRYDIFLHANLFPWDLAPGILLVREAGGTITGRDGSEVTIFSEGAIAAAPAVHADFLLLAGSRQ